MIQYHNDLVQGSEEWHAARCGVLTASEMKLILTPTLKVASNDKERAHLYELMAQRITKYVEPRYVSDDMLRGKDDEIYARALYAREVAEVQDAGFVTNDKWGFTIGYSPDGLVGDDGLVEFKSRRQKFQIETMVECVIGGTIPDDYIFQIQTGLMVSERKWCDFGSMCGGLPMPIIRVFPDLKIQEAIIDAATSFEKRLAEKMEVYTTALASNIRLIETERQVEEEMYIG